jgi:hypothetical protein
MMELVAVSITTLGGPLIFGWITALAPTCSADDIGEQADMLKRDSSFR